MLKIKKEQMQAFSRSMEEAFALRMVRHLLTRFPTDVARHGFQEYSLRVLVLRGIEEAKAFGVTAERDVRLYLECMIMFGPLFTCDPFLPWAARILGDRALSGTKKMDMIHNQIVFGGRR